MSVTLNLVLTGLIAGLAGAAAAIAPVEPVIASYLGGAAAILKIADGILTHQAVKS